MSSPPTDIAVDPLADTHNPNHYKVGTLTYTKLGLVTLFLYLLWGDFCFCIMETVMPDLLPLQLHKSHPPDWAIGLIFTTIPGVMTLLVNPIVSFRSDRYRGKWGRRIPFLMGATPFVVVFLILLAYAEPISHAIHDYVVGERASYLTVLMVVVGVMMVFFQLFNSFITAIYYYLFNDVVPRAFLARMMTLFRVVGSGAGTFYSFYIFPISADHMTAIFVGAALLYLVGFTVMCWKVKEGGYPPPPENIDHQRGFAAAAKTYAVECFTHRFYWLLFLANACWAMTWASAPWGKYVPTLVLGFDRTFIGHLGAITGLISLVLLFPAGILADRYHPLRIMLLGMAGVLIMAPLDILFVFMRHTMSLHTAEMINIAISAIKLPLQTIASAGEVALFMRLFPQDRYGQFCSANVLIRSPAYIIGGVACGTFLDYMKGLSPNPDDCYRFIPIWNGVFYFGYVFFYYLLYREWKKLGGVTGYVPPSAKPSKRFLAILHWVFPT